MGVDSDSDEKESDHPATKLFKRMSGMAPPNTLDRTDPKRLLKKLCK